VAEVVDHVHDVVLWVVAILLDKDIIVVVVSTLARLVAVEGNWVQLREDLGGEECHVKDVEHHLEIVLLLEDGQGQVAEALRLVHQVECHQLVTALHVLVLDYLRSVDEAADQVRGCAEFQEVAKAWDGVEETETVGYVECG